MLLTVVPLGAHVHIWKGMLSKYQEPAYSRELLPVFSWNLLDTCGFSRIVILLSDWLVLTVNLTSDRVTEELNIQEYL